MKLDKPLNLTFAQPTGNAGARALQAGSESNEQQIEALKKELEAKNKEISELKIINRQLQAQNEETQERQKLMDEELRKAEAQIELIMELINEPKNEKHDN